MKSEIRKIKVSNLIYYNHINRDYKYENIEVLKDDIKRNGLKEPIVVWGLDTYTYLVLDGIRRINAIVGLNKDSIDAKVLSGITEKDALNIKSDYNYVVRANIS